MRPLTSKSSESSQVQPAPLSRRFAQQSMSKGLQYEQVQVEMYRFTVFDLEKFTIAMPQSTSGAVLGFYVCIWVDLGYFNTCPKALELEVPCGHPWGRERRGWGGGKINPETSCNFMPPVCPVVYPFCGQCAPKSIANISVPDLWN